MLQKGQKKIEVAIKTVKNLEDPQDRRDFEREQTVMSRMAHPNIVTLYGLIHDDGKTIHISNKMAQKSLNYYRNSFNYSGISATW